MSDSAVSLYKLKGGMVGMGMIFEEHTDHSLRMPFVMGSMTPNRCHQVRNRRGG